MESIGRFFFRGSCGHMYLPHHGCLGNHFRICGGSTNNSLHDSWPPKFVRGTIPKGNIILQPSIFRGHVSCRVCKLKSECQDQQLNTENNYKCYGDFSSFLLACFASKAWLTRWLIAEIGSLYEFVLIKLPHQ